MTKILIKNGTIINEGRSFKGSVLIDGDCIADIIEDKAKVDQIPLPMDGDGVTTVDATGAYIMPGIIDSHVHFREPGLTHKADIESESRAAAYGGVTTFFDMPNTQPQTTTLEALEEKFKLAREKSHINYSFFFGATNDNYSLFPLLDRSRIPGVKLFMGSSTGNMLVDRYGSLLHIFENAARHDLQLMAHCEATDIINQNMAAFQKTYGDDPPVMLHPLIRSEEACLESSALAAQLARQFGTRLHIAHVTTARELDLQLPNTQASEHPNAQTAITLEACIAHLLFCADDYATRGTRIKCNPAVKTQADRDALRQALTDGRIATIATDHAPHLLEEKQGGCRRAASGMPMIQFSLPVMLTLAGEGVLPIERVVELMCHNPARLFRISKRGFLRPGYKADITIVCPTELWTVTADIIQSRCGWSPLEAIGSSPAKPSETPGVPLRWNVTHTFCNGQPVLLDGQFNPDSRGEAVVFSALQS